MRGDRAGAGNVQVVNLPNGVIISLLHDDDIPLVIVPLAPPDVICDGTPEDWPVIATGIGDIRAQDNDADVSLTRTPGIGTSSASRPRALQVRDDQRHDPGDQHERDHDR